MYLLSVVLIEVKKKENDGSAPDNAQQAPSVQPAHSYAPISIVTSGLLATDATATPQQNLPASVGVSPLRRLSISSDSSKSAKQESEDSDSSKEDYGAEDYLEVEACNVRPPEQTATTDNFTTMSMTEAVVEEEEEEEEEEKSSDVSVEDGLDDSTSDNAPLQSPQPQLSTPITISSISAFSQTKRLPGSVIQLPSLRSMGSKAMRAVFSIFALDWIILYFVYTLAWFVFRSQQVFLKGKYMIHTAHKRIPRDRRCPASTKVKVCWILYSKAMLGFVEKYGGQKRQSQ
jgi:hypothetical protein